MIGSNAGGVPELITEDSGLLVEPANPLDLKNAIKLFIEGKVSFDKNHLRDKALQNYSYEVVCSKFVDFYKTALDVAKRK